MGQGQAAEGPAAAMGSESMGVGQARVAVETLAVAGEDSELGLDPLGPVYS